MDPGINPEGYVNNNKSDSDGHDTTTNQTFISSVLGIYKVPTSIIILLSVFYGTISVLAVVGNFLVIWIVATSRRMQNVTNCFIANLALADIVIGLFAIPFQFQAALLQRWNLPNFMCPFCPFVQCLTVTVSVLTLTAIAVDRHRAILNPLSARPSKLRAKICIFGIWTLSSFLAAPMAIATGVTMEEEYTDPAGRIHLKPFCTNIHLSDDTMILYRRVLAVVQYAIPLSVISFVYARMALRLWGSKAPGNAQDSRDATLMKNKKKVIKMLVIVVALFAICWLPLQTYNVLQGIFPSINSYHYINIVFFCCDWLAMSNSCYNPFIYGIYNEKFKREFQLRFRPFKKRRRNWSSRHDSMDLDQTLTPCRASLHSTTMTNAYDWRRTYSSRGHTKLTTNLSNPLFYRHMSVRETAVKPNQSKQLSFNSHNSFDTPAKPCSQSDLEELCL
ncbi:RYamide receptor-like [Diaphorina citri]|uniref:RYamide receptor-like n=1 Tax=Diaphorina citri TaxID=121845 RepID=A0A3Q0J9Q6_DIACI|nr:RYamide receptor-like [Diaphorina citri]